MEKDISFPEKRKTFMNTTKTLFGILTIITALAVQVHAQNYLTKGLVAYYPLNGNANDASGNGNNGTVYNADFVTDPHGVTNGCCQFYGNVPSGNDNSYIDVTPTSSLNFTNGITVACWCVVDGSGYESPRLVSIVNSIHSGSDAGYCELTWRNGPPRQFVFAYGTNQLTYSQQATWAASFTNGQWLHLVGVAAGTSETLYVNGIMVSNVTGVAFGDIGQATVMNIGREDVNGGAGYDDFDGRMDEVRIYNRALSDSEVQQLYAYEYAIEFEPIVSLLRAVKPSFAYLVPGTNYQLQVSGDLINWTNQDLPFTATNTSMTWPQYFDVDNWGQLFFRLQVTP
jgi:Concanavalin A-like lectin/glucanases superfamily